MPSIKQVDEHGSVVGRVRRVRLSSDVPLSNDTLVLPAGGGVRVLGPFTVNFDDVGVEDDLGVVVTTIPAGAGLILTWCVVHQKFSTDDNSRLQMIVQFGDEHDYWQMEAWEVGGGTVVADGLAGADKDSWNHKYGAAFAVQGNLRAQLMGDPSGSEGSADIYALIAEPA